MLDPFKYADRRSLPLLLLLSPLPSHYVVIDTATFGSFGSNNRSCRVGLFAKRHSSQVLVLRDCSPTGTSLALYPWSTRGDCVVFVVGCIQRTRRLTRHGACGGSHSHARFCRAHGCSTSHPDGLWREKRGTRPRGRRKSPSMFVRALMIVNCR